MTVVPVWYPGDEVVVWGVNVLLQVTFVAAIALLAGRCLRQNPAARNWILCSALFLVLLSPVTALLVQSSRLSVFSVSLLEERPSTEIEETTMKEPEKAVTEQPKSASEPSIATTAQPFPMMDIARDVPFETSTPASTSPSDPPTTHGPPQTDSLAERPAGNASVSAPVPESPSQAFSLGMVLRTTIPPVLLFWLVGAVLLIVRLLRGWWNLACILRTAQPLAVEPLKEVIADACRALGTARTPQLVSSPSVTSPIAAGIWRPRVILPEGIREQLDRCQIRDILIHETAHILRRDQVVVLLQNLAAAVFWLHPLVRLVNRELACAREEVCDNHVLSFTDASSYSRTLLRLAELIARSNTQPGSVGLLTSDWNLETRVDGILNESRSTMTRLTVRGTALVIIISLVLAAAGAVTNLSLADNNATGKELVPAEGHKDVRDDVESRKRDDGDKNGSIEKRDSAASKSPATVDESPPNDIAEDIQQQIERLASTDFQVRSAATRRLIEIGTPAVAVLTNVKTTDREVAARIELILRTIRQNNAARKLAEIIERVTENEKLYRNLETVIRRETQFDPKKWAIPTVAETLHTVVQGDLIYFRGEEVRSLADGGKVQHRRVSAFDGKTTRSIEEGNSANIHLGRYEASQVFPPHTWGMFHLAVNFPLSVYLQGTQALKKHPKVRRYPFEKGSDYEFYKVECEFEKEEMVGNLRCVKIRCKRWYYTKDAPAIQYLWLATDRNYLCIKAQTKSRIEGLDLPANESRVEELREIAPKLWLPIRVSTKGYSYDALRENKLVVGRSRTQTVEKVVTNPRHPLSLFRDIKFPDGVPVYTIGTDGRLKNSPMHPSKRLEPGRTTLAEIIRHIGVNEKLYENIEVSVKAAYRMPWVQNWGVSDGFGVIPSYDVNSRSIRMGNRLYFHEDKLTRRLDGTSYTSRKTGTFDGRWSRIVDKSNRADGKKFVVTRATLRKQGGDDLAIHRPHMMLMRSDEKYTPLSRLLSSGWYNGDHDIEYVGDEMIGDLQCHKLRLIHVVSGQPPSWFLYLWLAKDRNYLPIRREFYYPYWSEKLPWVAGIADDLREVAPGVWFPYHVSAFLHKHATRDGLCENRLIVKWRKDFQVQSLTLKPNAPARQFSELVVPKGTKVSVRDENGKRVGSYKQEETGNISLADDKWLALLAKAKQTVEEQQRRQQALDALIGKPAPNFPQTEWLNGKPLTWKALSGKVVVLDFWAEWCGPCERDLKRLSELNELWKDLDKSDRVIIGVHTAGSKREAVQKAGEKHKLSYPICIDTAPKDGEPGWGTLFNRFAVNAIPHTVVIDQQGNVVAHGRLEDMLSKAAQLLSSARDK